MPKTEHDLFDELNKEDYISVHPNASEILVSDFLYVYINRYMPEDLLSKGYTQQEIDEAEQKYLNQEEW
jgi:hypothetical protein